MTVIDVLLIVIYLGVTLAIGIAYRGKQENAEDYFTASGRMRSGFQTLLVGLSIAATLFSGISFLMYPATSYGKGIALMLMLVPFPVGWILLRYWFLSRFLNQGVKHPYDVIERKFGSGIRTQTAVLYTGLRIGWMSILIHAPTVAILAASGLNERWRWPLILAIGIGGTLYATVGGIRGVIITDAMQFVIIAAGVAVTIVFIMVKLPNSMSETLTILQGKELFRINFSINPKVELGFWAVVLGSCFGNLANWMGDQMSLQRYLANGDVKAAARSTAFNLIGSFCVVLLLVVLGLALAAWFHVNPDNKLPTEVDKVFPYFIANHLPAGTAGLLLAAILAATISSLTSGVNTLASTFTFDFRLKYGSPLTPAQQLRFGRYMTLVVGVLSTVVAGFVGALGTIFQMAQFLLGLFAGPIFVCVLLSITKIRVHKLAMGIAMVAGFAAGLAIRQVFGWYHMWTSPMTFVVTFSAALLLTPVFDMHKKGS